MRCPNCRTEVPDGFGTCAVCGTELAASPPVPGAARDDRPSATRGRRLVADADSRQVPPRTGPIPRWDLEGGARTPLPQTGPLPAIPRPAAGDAAARVRMLPPTGPQPQVSRAGPREVFGPADGEVIATRLLEEDPQSARETRIIDVSVPAVVKRSGRLRGAEASRSPAGDREASLAGPLEDVVDGVRQAYARLHRLDRLTVWVLFGCFLAAFLPWRHVRGVGLVSGIETAGAVSAGCAAAALLWIYRRTVHRRRAALYVLLQLLFAAGTGAGALHGFIAGEGSVAAGLLAVLGGAAFAVLLTLLRLLRLGGA